MIPSPRGFALNDAYVLRRCNFFLHLQTVLANKDSVDLQAILSSKPFESIRAMQPFVPFYPSNEPRPRLSLAQAYSARIVAWNTIDDVLSQYFFEDSREQRIDALLASLTASVRYLHLRSLALKVDMEFATLSYHVDLYGAMHTSEILLENAGKPLFDKATVVVSALAQAFFAICGDRDDVAVFATEEQLEAFRRDHPDLCRYYD